MKKILEKYLKLISIVGLLIVLVPLNVYANENKEIKENTPTDDTYILVTGIKEVNDSGIKVSVKRDVLEKIDKEELNQMIIDLVKDNDDGEDINIIDISEDYNDLPIENRIEASYRTVTTKSNVQKNRVLEDRYLFSVARGQTKKVSSTYKYTASATGGYKNLSEITGSAVYTKSVVDTFTGPSSASYNTREYRIKFYGEKGNYVQKLYERLANKEKLKKTYSGTYKSAKKAMIYSKDKKI